MIIGSQTGPQEMCVFVGFSGPADWGSSQGIPHHTISKTLFASTLMNLQDFLPTSAGPDQAHVAAGMSELAFQMGE